MVRVPQGFCIDRTEVTRGAYFAWLETEPALGSCTPNDDLTPSCETTGSWGPDRNLENPVACVDFCDARTFCEAHGKRLCGAIGGGAADPTRFDDASHSEWFAACSSGGANAYTYGSDEEAHRCRDSPEEGWAQVDVGSLEGCRSPDPEYADIVDLSGNLAEWEDSCAEGRCRIRGGSYSHSGPGLRCDAGRTLMRPPETSSGIVGFRCCAD